MPLPPPTAGRILLIGYGNPGRCDDGLGPRCAVEVQALDLPGVTVESNYQLNVEDAEMMARFDVVIFADASVDCPEPFAFTGLEPKTELNFSTHSVAPAALLAMAQELFDAEVVGYTLAIRGYRFNEFEESLTVDATGNLKAAIGFMRSVFSAAPEACKDTLAELADGIPLKC